MRRLLLTAALLALSFHAGPASADDASDRLKLAEQVVVTAHVADNMRKIMPMMMAQLKPLVEKQGSTDSAQLDKFTTLFNARAAAAADGFADKVAQVYATEFSAKDLTNLLSFYGTETGQDLLSKQTVIAQASFALGKQMGQDLAKQVLDDMAKEKEAKPSKM